MFDATTGLAYSGPRSTVLKARELKEEETSAPSGEAMYEAMRLDALHQLRLLDTPPSESFDRITRLASQIFELPIAAVSLTDSDRQWFKSRVGIDHWSIPRQKAPCGEVADCQDFVLIRDMLADAFYSDSLLARSGIRFYAGAPLVTREGYGLGALCVLGTEPRDASDVEIAALKDLAAMVMVQIELQHAFGRIDPVSGLPSRNQFLDDLCDLAKDCGTPERAALLIDLLAPDKISDCVRVHGPSRLDNLVRTAVRELREIVGRTSTIYHVGHTQFALLLPHGADAEGYAGKIRSAALRLPGQIGCLSQAAIGIVHSALKGRMPAVLLRALHNAVQDARAAPGLVSLYSEEADRLHRRRYQLLEDFGSALAATGQLRLVYQPRVCLRTGHCIGAEALLRWQHPQLGNVPPADFIPIVESSPLASPLTSHVLSTALQQLREWRAAGMTLNLSVNISAANLSDGEFAAATSSALIAHEISGDQVELEVTENALMDDAAQARVQLQNLSNLGISVAIDDFGTGQSSLAYLQKLPVDLLKIDRSFIIRIDQSKTDQVLARAMISLAHDLGYRVVAEGVETAGAAALLRELGCDEAQGYHFAPPMEAADFAMWVSSAADA